MYMIWLATVMNGQQRPIDVPSILVLAGEAITASAAGRAIAAAIVLAIAMTTSPLGHFYICRT